MSKRQTKPERWVTIRVPVSAVKKYKKQQAAEARKERAKRR